MEVERPVAVGGLVGALLAGAVRPGTTALDCGGGSGRYAVPLAQAGVHVTVLDVSIDALATLRRRAGEAGVGDLVADVQGDVEALDDAIEHTQSYDLVLAHGILDVVDSPAAVFAAIAGRVEPGGLLSVLVANPVAAVLGRALSGDLTGAERELRRLDGPSDSPDAVRGWCTEHGLSIEQQHGVGVFTDLVPGQALDAPGAREALARLESACAQRHPFAEIAGRVHLLARLGHRRSQ